MADHDQPVRVAVVQAASVIMDREATIAKAMKLIGEAAAGGAKLVVFPEAFVSAYPRGLSFGVVVGQRSDEGRRLFARYAAALEELREHCTFLAILGSYHVLNSARASTASGR